MNYFTGEINNWKEWGEVYQSIPHFLKLIEYIFKKENLPLATIEHLTPGTNAVFKVGDLVVKIFAPKESGIDSTLDRETELFSTNRANKLGVSTPKLVTDGFVEDKYRFAYMIMEYIDGSEVTKALNHLSHAEKVVIGQKLRMITDKLNTSCEPFNNIDVVNDKGRYRRFDKYLESFKQERLSYITSHVYSKKVFVHGDLCGDNILLTKENELFIIDFADAILAPIEYEHALIAVELFHFDPSLIYGYFGNFRVDELAQMCFDGLLIHDFGGDIITQHLGKINEFDNLDKLKTKIYEIVKNIKL